MNSTKVQTLGTTKIVHMRRYIGMRVQIFEKACGQKTETKEKEAHCLTLSCITGGL